MSIKNPNWHIVQITPQLPAWKYKQKVGAWIEEQFQNSDFDFWIEYSSSCYGFKREEDAMAFKLRWS